MRMTGNTVVFIIPEGLPFKASTRYPQNYQGRAYGFYFSLDELHRENVNSKEFLSTGLSLYDEPYGQVRSL